MDQQMAIKFIYDNAHKIGGDKNRITIGGESAGSISSSFQMLVPESKSMISQVILQSGKPNAACGEWCTDVSHGIRHICDLDNFACSTAGKSTQQVVDTLREIPNSVDIYHFVTAVSGSSINTLDGVFFKVKLNRHETL